MNDYFMPLSGANEIGASAYFLNVDGVRILLDTGARIRGDEIFPDYGLLLNELDDYQDIDFILLSHAHYDHIGSLPYIASLAGNAEILCTQATKEITKLQLLDFGRILNKEEKECIKKAKYRQAEAVMQRLRVLPVHKTFQGKNCKITFYPAGHMPGAVMIYIETENHKILYTGDFSFQTMFGVNQLRLGEIHPDILLLNGTNAYQFPEKERNGGAETYYSNRYESLLHRIEILGRNGQNILMNSRSIAKHLDLFYLMNFCQMPMEVYVDEESEKIGEALTDLGYGIFTGTIRTGKPQSRPHILISGEEARMGYTTITFDHYTLHASGRDLLVFIKSIGAEKTYLLHTYPKRSGDSILKRLLNSKNSEKAPAVTQAQNGKKYNLENLNPETESESERKEEKAV